MFFRQLSENRSSEQMIDTFRGYYHNLRVGEGMFYDMKNMSPNAFPSIAPRRQRRLQEDFDAIQAGDYKYYGGMVSVGGDIYLCKGYKLFRIHKVNGVKTVTEIKNKNNNNFFDDSFPQITVFGKFILFLEATGDARKLKYLNTANTSDRGDVDFSAGTLEVPLPVSVTPCTLDGGDITYTKSETMPTDPANGAMWLDNSVTPNVLKIYSSATGVWTTVATTYVRISYSEDSQIFKDFEELDAIKLTETPEEGVSHVLPEGIRDQYNIIQKKTANQKSIVIVCPAIDRGSTKIVFSNKAPNMDFICVNGNRVWGCRYGTSVDDKEVNEIYASKLGSFSQWNCFAGIASDSYVASCGTDGAFTGAVAYIGYPIFFKEKFLHKVYGNTPDSFQISATECYGIARGAFTSASVVDSILYYKGKNGVYQYDGSLPVEISAPFGDVKYSAGETNGVAGYAAGAGGSFQSRYYVSLKSEEDGKWNLFVYDTRKKIWYREDETAAIWFANHDNRLYFGTLPVREEETQTETITGDGAKTVFTLTKHMTRIDSIKKSGTALTGWTYDPTTYKITFTTAPSSGDITVAGIVNVENVGHVYSVATDAEPEEESEKVEWFVTTGLIGIENAEKKYLSHVSVRMKIGIGDVVMFHVKYDSQGEWEHLYTMNGSGIRSFSVPIRPKRCDHFQIRISGKGKAQIFSITKVFEKGSIL